MEDKQVYFIDKSRLVKAFILIVWTCFIVYMIWSGRYRNYLHPSLVWVLIMGIILMIPMIISLLSSPKKLHTHDKDCLEMNRPCSYKHRLIFADIKPLLIFSIPIIIVFCFPLSRGLSATMVGGIFTEEFDQTLSRELSKKERNSYDGIPEYSISEIKSAPSKIPEKAAVTGMVYKSKTVKKPCFILIRFYINCCAADARPVMLEVSPMATAVFDYNSLPNNEWVLCIGTAEASGEYGKRVIFKASEIKPIPKPEDEYMY